jgi:LacI family transcriptional regulator
MSRRNSSTPTTATTTAASGITTLITTPVLIGETGGGIPEKVTIQEVARVAGVSKGTVSRVLNGRDGVNGETRAQVLGVVERLGYVPDPGARKLARGNTHIIGIAPFAGDLLTAPYYSVLLAGLQERFAGEGYTARILEPGQTGLPDENADGLVVLGVRLGDPRFAILDKRAIPYVVVGETNASGSWVDIDNHHSMLEVVEHLIQLGHRQIVHLTGASNGQASHQRYRAYLAALERHQISYDPALILDGHFSELGGYRALRRALDGGLKFSAIASSSDEMASGALAALEDSGLRVPWDVSVTGFDDLPMASRTSPALTTVRQPIREVGHAAAELLLERLAGKPARQIQLPSQLVLRASSATKR